MPPSSKGTGLGLPEAGTGEFRKSLVRPAVPGMEGALGTVMGGLKGHMGGLVGKRSQHGSGP